MSRKKMDLSQCYQVIGMEIIVMLPEIWDFITIPDIILIIIVSFPTNHIRNISLFHICFIASVMF